MYLSRVNFNRLPKKYEAELLEFENSNYLIKM